MTSISCSTWVQASTRALIVWSFTSNLCWRCTASRNPRELEGRDRRKPPRLRRGTAEPGPSAKSGLSAQTELDLCAVVHGTLPPHSKKSSFANHLEKRPTKRPTFRPTGPVGRLASHLIRLQNSGVRRFPGAPTTLFGRARSGRGPLRRLESPLLQGTGGRCPAPVARSWAPARA